MVERVLFLSLLLLVAGCSEPTIDKENPKESLSKVKSSLSPEKLQKFEDAWTTVSMNAASDAMGSALTEGDDEAMNAFDSYLAQVDGMTADDVIAYADSIERAKKRKERREAVKRIKELRQMKREAKRAEDSLSQFRVLQSTFRMREREFMGAQPVVELTVQNGTDHAISQMYFDATLESPDREVPWLEDRFSYEISGGIEPGERKNLQLAPNQFSEWGDVDQREDMELRVNLFRLDGPDGEALFEADWTKEEEQELQRLMKEYGEHIEE